MKKLVFIAALSLCCITLLAACGKKTEENVDAASTEVALETVETESAEKLETDNLEQEDSGQSVEASSAEMAEITMTVGDTVITAELTDSETTRAFLETLPRSLTMNRYGEREYYGRIDALSENGEAIPDFENGDVTYYPAGPSFAIFFAGEDSSNQGGLIRMGRVTSDLSVFDTLGDTVEMHITIQEQETGGVQ